MLLIATQDSNSFFHDFSPGADANIADVAAVVAIVQAIASIEKSKFRKQFFFSLFTAESWGFTGSRAFAKDISQFNCTSGSSNQCYDPYRSDLEFTNLHISQISSIIELNQIATATSDDPPSFFVHHDNEYGNPLPISSEIAKAAQKLGVNVKNSSIDFLPPSSLMSFLRNRPSISGVVVTDYDSKFANQ